VTVSTDPEGVVELTDGRTITLTPHRRRDNLMVGQLHVRPLVPEMTLIQCELDGRLAEALVEVREERASPPAPLPPAEFEFEKPRYRVGWTKSKNLTLRAPINVMPAGSVVNVSSSAPGIVVLTGQVTMSLDIAVGYLTGQVRIEGRALGAEGTLRARRDDLTAECRVLVANEEEGPSLRFEIADKDGGKYRALWEEREDPAGGERIRILEIQGRHPALRHYLGGAPEFPGQNDPWTRLILAEIVTDNVCREIARRVDAIRSPDERPDAETFYAEHYNRTLKLLPVVQSVLLPSSPG
jgi:hypothetical protein